MFSLIIKAHLHFALLFICLIPHGHVYLCMYVCVYFQGFGPCQLLLKHAAYQRMLIFLLGPHRQSNQVLPSEFPLFMSEVYI